MINRTIFNVFLFVFIGGSFLFSGILQAQNEISPIQFHGSNKAFGQYSNHQGINSQIPPSLLRNEFNMSLTIYGIPVSSSFFITSEQSDFRQSINNFRIYFDLKSLIKNKAKGLVNKEMSGFMHFLSNFKTIEVGKCRPNYSSLTLKGVSVSGVNIEFTPGEFYAAFSTGKVKRPIKYSEISKPAYKQKLLFGKIGFGKKRKTHLYLTFMKLEDELNSLPVSMEIDTFNIKPQSNYVVGTEGQLSFFKRKFTIEGEAAVSLYTRDICSPSLIEEDTQVPSWLANVINPNASSSADFAYHVKSTLKLKTTKISGGVRMIGAGFKTLGNPNLLNDRLIYDGRIDQSFAKRQISLSAYFRQRRDNLINWKTATTNTITYGITAGFRFRKIPYLMISYTPYSQNTDNDSLIMNNSVNVYSVVSGYNYSIGNLKSSTSFNFFYQDTEILSDTNSNFSNTNTYTLNEVLIFKIPLSIAAAVSYSNSEFSEEKRNILSFSFSGTHRAFKSKWKNTIGVRYSNRINEQKKYRFFYISKMKLWKGTEFDIRVEENIFRNTTQIVSNYDEFILRVSLLSRW